MRRQLIAALATLVLAASPIWAANGNIGLFFDVDAALCQKDIPCEGYTWLYVYALLQGSSQNGITGAEFKVRTGPDNNVDAGWDFVEVVQAPWTSLGGAFTPIDNSLRGANFYTGSGCQIGDGTKILLEKVRIYNDCVTTELQLTVVKHDFPSNQYFQCPLFVLCDDPVFTKVCLGSNLTVCRNPEPPYAYNATCSTSGQAYCNPIPGRDCRVGVSPATWSAVKGLYSH